jgi:hypothetical protein
MNELYHSLLLIHFDLRKNYLTLFSPNFREYRHELLEKKSLPFIKKYRWGIGPGTNVVVMITLVPGLILIGAFIAAGRSSRPSRLYIDTD